MRQLRNLTSPLNQLLSLASPRNRRPETVDGALKACRTALIGVGLISCLVNILFLTGSIYMLEVYDRVLPSRSIPTLVALTGLAVLLFAAQGFFDFVRGRILVRTSLVLDNALNHIAFNSIGRISLTGAKRDPLQPSQDLDQIRSFVAGGGPIGFFDLPWMPFYMAICFLFHPMIGFAALFGAVVLLSLTLLTELGTREATRSSAAQLARRNQIAEASRRNSEALQAMGMGKNLYNQWRAKNRQYLIEQTRASDVALGLGSISRVSRMLLQSLILGLAAYLVVGGEATAGVMIASSILVSRALAPVELVIAHWRGFAAARQGWTRVMEIVQQLPKHELVRLPPPRERLTVETISVAAPGDNRLIVRNVSFELLAGSALGIVGNSGAGKSTLIRALIGAWNPNAGQVRLDGAALNQWSPDLLGRHIGYVPQNVELFSGTVAENIARFEPGANSKIVIAAACAAGVHDLIMRLPQGYNTELGDRGELLSAGQRQRIALARALYDNPFLVVLDEPNSNLDSEGDVALTGAIQSVRERGGIAIVVAHRQSALAAVDLLMVLNNGIVQAYGPKDNVLRALASPQPTAAPASASVSLKTVGERR